METFDPHDSIITKKILEDEKIEWVPLSLTLVDYPKGIYLFFHTQYCE